VEGRVWKPCFLGQEKAGLCKQALVPGPRSSIFSCGADGYLPIGDAAEISREITASVRGAEGYSRTPLAYLRWNVVPPSSAQPTHSGIHAPSALTARFPPLVKVRTAGAARPVRCSVTA
jgi:hypothetical protein